MLLKIKSSKCAAMSSQKLRVLKKRVICCNPFKIHEIAVSNGLRQVSDHIRNEHRSLHCSPADQLCTSCRKRVSALPSECQLSQSEQSDVDAELGSKSRCRE